MQVFKEENRIDLYAKNKTAKKFNYLKHFKICDWSGTIGPKRKQGDYQVPEGFYFIEALNPKSSYHLSMNINYPISVVGKEGSQQIYRIVGPLCFAGDVLYESVNLPILNEGDEIIINNTGANTLSMWSKHCSREEINFIFF